MAKKNAQLVGETAEVLLNKIKEQAENYGQPEQLRILAEAFATVAAADPVDVGSKRGGSAIVL